jgi:hypothetical protein
LPACGAHTQPHPPTQMHAENTKVLVVLAGGVLGVLAYGYGLTAITGVLGVLRCGQSAPAMAGVVGGSVVWCSLRAWAANNQTRGYSEYSLAGVLGVLPYGHGAPAALSCRRACTTDRHVQSERLCL